VRKSNRDRHLAIAQFIALVLVIGALGALAAWNSQRRADAAQLALPLAELRSQSAELANLQHEFETGSIDERFLRTHTHQLLPLHDASRRELEDLLPWPELAAAQHASLDDARQLEKRLHTVAGGGHVDETEIDALRDRMRGRERALRN
jgi:hypothetical protein